MVEQLKKPLILLIGFFLLLFLYTKFAGPIPFAVNSVSTTTQDVFQVSGVGKTVAAPDTASISFGVTKTAGTVADAQNQTNTAISEITQALKDAGIDEKDMQTTNYSVNPNYDFTNARQTVTGYTVTQNIDVKITPLDKANTALDIMTSKGANVVGQVSFGFSDSVKKQLEEKARRMAVDDAKSKAQSLANASGIHLGRIINVVENSQMPIIQPLALNGVAKDAGSGAPTQLTPGENTVSLTVTLSYQIY